MDDQPLLIVGLGNPGKEYEYTRHNMGFLVLKELAKIHNINLIKKNQMLGSFGSANVNGKKVLLLMPETYMNLSGQSVRRCLDFYKLSVNQLLVVVDDVYQGFGAFRFRDKGSPGGHNGLKNIQSHLGSDQYSRLRIGVGNSKDVDLSSYVVGKFDQYELNALDQIISKATTIVDGWIQDGSKGATQTIASLQRVAKEKEVVKEDNN